MALARGAGAVATAASWAPPPKPNAPLVFDVGCEFGQDALFYLSLGFHVVAVDANPWAVSSVNGSFAHYASNGALRVVHGIIATGPGSKQGRRFCARRVSEHSGAEGEDTPCDGELLRGVPSISCRTLIARFGVPMFMKVDIESSSMDCIRSLRPGMRPRYLSAEIGGSEDFLKTGAEWLRALRSLGYASFKVATQSIYYPSFRPFGGGSGLFGEDAVDALRGAAWRSANGESGIAAELHQYAEAFPDEWWDIHARAG